ncbi:MAG TPA: ABC transporter permease subunit [Candidatus Acidoferrum sp.]|nr:ABC transporter permease subunit [Candidatus Acidoferrum sp.]
MRLPPLVERELRSGARRPVFTWLRGALALVLTLQAYDLLTRYGIAPRPRVPMMAATPPPMTINGSMLLENMTWLLFIAVLLMGLLTADAISRERREGTLSLLLLTHVSPAQLVYGKLLSCGLTCFILLLACSPVLMFTVLVGGVTGGEAAMTGIGLLNTLFVSLAAGLWMSAVFRERRHAMGATLALIVALTFVPEVMGESWSSARVPFMRLFALVGWISAARSPIVFGTVVQVLGLFNSFFVCWFIVTHVIGWLILWQAARSLAANWRDEPHAQVRAPEPQDAWALCERAGYRAAPPVIQPAAEVGAPQPAAAHASWLTDPRPWDADPIEWRVRQMRPPEGLVWFAVAVDFLAQFGALGSMFGNGGKPGSPWGLMSFGGLVLALFGGGLLAWAGGRFFLDTRQQQDLELLLTSPVGSRNILAGQWRVLRNALTWPLFAVLLLAAPSLISVLWDLSMSSGVEVWSVSPTFLIAVNLILEVLALCWVGMYFGLRARTKFAAITRSIGLVQLLPLALALAISAGWSLIVDPSLPPLTSHRRMPLIIPVLLFFLVKNVALAVWASFRLRRDLRLGRDAATLDNSAFTPILQPA